MSNPFFLSPETVSILVLDYNKPEESRLCLESIRANFNFDKQVIFLSNGGEQKHVYKFYDEGLIDRLIFNKNNNGLGYGTEDLFRFCDTEYAIYFQNDQIVAKPVNQDQINLLISYIKDNKDIGAISLAGFPCGENVYSERAHLINVNLYNSIPKTHGGCGPFNHLRYNENCVQEFFKENNLKFINVTPQIVQDNGVWTIRELPCGGEVKMRTDTKETWWIKNPKQKYVFPEMTDEEWELSISGKWVGGQIPELMKKNSFNCWGNIYV